MLSKAGLTVLGIDIVEEMLAIARDRVTEVRFELMDARSLAFADQAFDGVWSARTLIHIPSPEVVATLREWKRVLKPGGVLCVCVIEGDFEGIEPEYYDPSGETETFFHYFREEELAANLREAGFELIETDRRFLGEEKEPHLFVFAEKADSS